VVGPRLEDLGRRVGRQDHDATGAHVRRGGLDRPPQVALAREVGDRVVGEHHVEHPPEAERPHVADEMLALRVQRPAEGEHLGRQVGQRALEAGLQVRGVVAAARAELEERARLTLDDLVDDPRDEIGLVPVGRRVRQQVEPGREIRVQPHRLSDREGELPLPF